MLLIDCYNVLHTTMPAMLAGLNEAELCRALSRTSWVRRGIVVVADGKPKPHGITRSPVAEVELRYSGPGQSADDVLIEMVQRHSAPKKLTVVSTDHEIRRAGRRRRARVWTSDHFIHRLVDQLGRQNAGREAQAPPPTKHAPESQSKEEIDAWLKQFGYAPSPDESSSTNRANEGKDDPYHVPGLWPPW